MELLADENVDAAWILAVRDDGSCESVPSTNRLRMRSIRLSWPSTTDWIECCVASNPLELWIREPPD